jgi:ABC-type transporter Mla maintaining outer membrane lipid asymmetry ATPase subunit MlaF
MQKVDVPSTRDTASLIVSGVDWTVKEGDYWMVAGLQGSGKTDFLMMTGGVMAPASGEYLLYGEKMPIFDEGRLATRLLMGLVFEGGQLFNHLTVRENVALPLRYHHNLAPQAGHEAVSQLLEALELLPWADSTPGAIGRHWQKRVGLARALALKPSLLLLDNPLAGLDLRHLNWWAEFLQALSRGSNLTDGRPVTVIATGAELHPWKDRAQEFAVLRNKKFTVVGTWDQLAKAKDELLHELISTELTE